jgi:hypothetical protein
MLSPATFIGIAKALTGTAAVPSPARAGSVQQARVLSSPPPTPPLGIIAAPPAGANPPTTASPNPPTAPPRNLPRGSLLDLSV